MNINDWCKRVRATAESKGWQALPEEFGTLIALVHSEASEALEEWRNGHAVTETYHRADGKPEGVPSELADVCIRVFHMADALGIDLETAIANKDAFNATRPHRHGGKIA